jgi:hypothetical protein
MSLCKTDQQLQDMKKLIFTIFILSLITSSLVNAQLSSRQAGFRFGYRSGIFYQMTTEAGNAEIGYNALLSFNNNGLQLTGLKIIYENSLNSVSPNLFFAWGYGGHVGFMYSDHLKFMGENYYFPQERFCPLFGADGWVAAEYRISDIPLTISLNFKPFIEVTIPAFVRVVPTDFGFSISYVF